MPSFPLHEARVRRLRFGIFLVTTSLTSFGCGEDQSHFSASRDANDGAVDATISDSSTPGTDSTVEDASNATHPPNDGASSTPADAARADSGEAGFRSRDGGDASAPTLDAGTCEHRTVWYGDADGDGFGDPAKVFVACTKPASGNWVDFDGDCDDRDARVHPHQTSYFVTAYRTVGGAESFDYDCSGMEDGDPSQAIAPASCGLLSLTLCGGSGYSATSRTGLGVDAHCGSTMQTTCVASVAGLLVCQSVTATAGNPYGCR
jgi:hypothetical protein